MNLADFAQLFALSVSPLELVIRGSVIYWFLFLIFRFLNPRDIGTLGFGDVLLLVLIADAAQNAMAGEYKSITDGCILVGTIIGWNFLLDWAAYRFPIFRRLAEPRPMTLVRNGRIERRNLRREFITVDELTAKLREHGIEHLQDVKLACVESDGEISVIRARGDQDASSGRSHRAI